MALSRSSIFSNPVDTSAYTGGLITNRPASRAWTSALCDHVPQVGSSVSTSSSTFESISVTGAADQDLELGTGLLIAYQTEQLIRAQRGVRPAMHLRHKARAASVAGLYSHDAQCLAVLHDRNF